MPTGDSTPPSPSLPPERLTGLGPVADARTVVRVLANRSMGAPGQDMDAADKRPALGMRILTGLRASGDGTLTGDIYNRENAKTYSVQLTMDGPQQMLVRPYVGIPLFGKTQLWHRVPAAAVGAEVRP